jgi:hypothetical protein
MRACEAARIPVPSGARQDSLIPSPQVVGTAQQWPSAGGSIAAARPEKSKQEVGKVPKAPTRLDGRTSNSHFLRLLWAPRVETVRAAACRRDVQPRPASILAGRVLTRLHPRTGKQDHGMGEASARRKAPAAFAMDDRSGSPKVQVALGRTVVAAISQERGAMRQPLARQRVA